MEAKKSGTDIAPAEWPGVGGFGGAGGFGGDGGAGGLCGGGGAFGGCRLGLAGAWAPLLPCPEGCEGFSGLAGPSGF